MVYDKNMKPNKAILINFIIVLIGVLFGWFLIIAPYSKVENVFQQLPTWINSAVVQNYPEDLTISINKGIVSMTKESPYCLVLPLENNAPEKLSKGIVIDINASADVSEMEVGGIYSNLCQPIALIGKNFVLYPDENNAYKYVKISDQINVEIDRELINKLISQYLPLAVSFGKNVYYILPFLVIPLLFLGFLSQNYWYSLIVRLAIKIFKITKISFGESYKISLFFYNFILLIDWVLIRYVLNNLLGLEIAISFPFFNTIMITLASVLYLKKTQSPDGLASVSSPIVSTPIIPTNPMETTTPLITPKVTETSTPIVASTTLGELSNQTTTETQPTSTSIPTGQ